MKVLSMKSLKQLARQPLKTLAGVVLVTLAVAVLCISLGQSMAAANMEQEVEKNFVTTALATNKYQYYEELAYLTRELEDGSTIQSEYTKRTVNMEKPDEVTELMLSLAEAHPEIVLSIEQPGLATAYVPTMTADNYTKYVSTANSVSMTADSDWSVHYLNGRIDADPTNAPYSQVVAQVTLTDISRVEGYYDQWAAGGTAGEETLKTLNQHVLKEDGTVDPAKLDIDDPDLGLEAVTLQLTGTIDRVLGLQEGYADPTGYTARMTLIVPGQAELDALELEVGESYLVYGMDYTDLDYSLRNYIFAESYGIVSKEFGDGYSATAIDAFDPENLHMLSQENIDGYTWYYRYEHNGEYPPSYQAAYYIHEQINEDGSVTPRCINLTNLDMLNYRSVSFSIFDLSAIREDLGESYAVPTITKLEGSAEDFLSGEDGGLWTRALEGLNISNHSFAVLGVDNLNAVGCFATQSAWLSQGRNFNKAEIAEGKKVCIISEYLAEMNGLSIGDTIPMQYLAYDWDSPYQNFLSDGYGVIKPGGYFYSINTGFAGEAERYTIVGLYGKETLWPSSSGSLYGITPNTIFVPKASVTGDMDYAEQGNFYSAVLKNGSHEEFAALMKSLGEDGLFIVDDQGYTEVKASLHDYQSVAKQAMTVGIGVYAIILLLFLFLFPAMQGKVLTTMGSLGATRREKLAHMALSTLGILVPGTVLGLIFGCALWQKVVGELTSSARVVLELELDVLSLALVAAAQLAVAFVLAFFISVPMTRQRGMRNTLGRVKGFFRRLGRTPLKGWTTVLFAAVIAASLCALNAANEAELADYETAYQNTPVKVTLMSANSQNAYNLGASGFVTDLFTDERFAKFTPLKYVEDVQYMCSLKPTYINYPVAVNTLNFSGMTSGAEPPDLTDTREYEIFWEESYDWWVFDSEEEMYLLLPESVSLKDYDPDTEGTQLLLGFTNYVMVGYYGPNEEGDQGTPKYELREYEVVATVAGRYDNSVDSQVVYCSFYPLQTAADKSQQSIPLDHISATMKNNDEVDALREMASQWFADPTDSASSINKDYALAIDTGVLENLKATLENSMTVNRVCTLLVFILSAGAGFFLGFLMIRSRKREIILMRTLGKPNGWIFRDFAWEQMRSVLLGTVLGGLVFRWEPVGRLVLFALLYFIGLGLALVIFLNSKLLTTIKEDE